MKQKKMIVALGLVLLGVAMIVIGAMVPPVLTGVGFLLLAWGWEGR